VEGTNESLFFKIKLLYETKAYIVYFTEGWRSLWRCERFGLDPKASAFQRVTEHAVVPRGAVLEKIAAGAGPLDRNSGDQRKAFGTVGAHSLALNELALITGS
jgi:hypothetical protein